MKTIRTATAVGAVALATTLGACNSGSSGASASAPKAPTSSSSSATAAGSSSTQAPSQSSNTTTANTASGSSTTASARTTTVTKGAPASPSTNASARCGTMSASTATQLAVQKAPNPFPAEDHMRGWTTENADNHYDPCADLSWITITIPGGTVSSPYQIALFHRGTYLGTATEESYGFAPGVSRINGSSIQSVYRYVRGNECNACATGRATARFTWNEAQQKVVMTGSVPPN